MLKGSLSDICVTGAKGNSLKIHSLLIASISPWVKQIMSEAYPSNQILLPDFDSAVLIQLANLAYTGE